MKRRAFTRINLFERATIRYGEQFVGGLVENISLRGLFVQTKEQIPLNLPVEVSVHLSHDSSLSLSATVVRHGGAAGLGMKINRIDMQSLRNLKNLVEKHCGDQELVTRETKKMVSFMLA